MTSTLTQIASSFIAPALALAGVLAVALPVVIHLLSRMRRKRERWGAMRFLRLAYQKQKNRLRLEQWLLLLMRCLLVLLIGLALAGPVVGGALARWVRGAGGGGRVLHLVMDDALTSGVLESGASASRLEALKGEAEAMLEGLGSGDRAVLWRTSAGGAAGEPGQGWGPVAESGSEGGLGAVRLGLEAMEPGEGAADWSAVVSAVTRRVEADGAGGSGRPVVAVLSGFSRGAGRLLEASAGDGALGELALVGVARPGESRGNRQVARVVPRRAVVLAGDGGGGGGGSVEVAVTLGRFEDTAERGTARLRVGLWSAEGGGGLVLVSSAAREVVWSVGQAVLTQTVSVALPRLGEGRESAGLVVRAVVESAGGVDALVADDAGMAVVEVVRGLRVGVQGGEASGENGLGGGGLGPGAFVRAALGEGGEGVGGGGFEAVSLAAVEVEGLASLDGVFVLSPGRLSAKEWSALGVWVQGGGVAWVMPGAGDGEGALGWLGVMGRAFAFSDVGGGVGGGGVEARGLDEAVGLEEGGGAPAGLRLLSGSWGALLGPVRVGAYVAMGGGEGEGVWIRVGSGDVGDVGGGVEGVLEGAAWLVARDHGRGTLLWLGSALDPDWTNLAAKPLFPALVQEALRSAVAGRLGVRSWRVGETAAVEGGSTLAAQRLFFAGEGLENKDKEKQPGVESAGLGEKAGVFEVKKSSETSGGLYGVNVNSPAGDTEAMDEAALSAWWDGVGAWQFLSDDPAELLAQEAPRAALGWWLLWLVLGLLVLEAVMSRAFSHATTDRPGVTRRVLGWVERWRHGEFAGGKAA